MELAEFCRLVIVGLLLVTKASPALAESRFPMEGKECTTRHDIPVIKLTSYTTVVPLEISNNIIFSSFSMSKRLLQKETRPVRNVTVETMDQCLGEGGMKDWSVPISNKSAFISEVVIECFDQGIGPVIWEYNGLGDFQVGNDEVPENTHGNRTSKHLYMPTSYKLVFRNLSDQISGNYSCRSVDFPEKVNFFYLYAPQSGGRPYLIQRGKTINITQEDGNSLVTLPCISNNPNSKHQAFHIYDPKKGFVIDVSDRGIDPFGMYVCTSNPDIRDSSDRIRIHLLPPAGVSRKSDGFQHPTIFNYGSQLVKNSYKRFRDIVNSFLI